MKIGSLFSGYGGLDMGVRAVLGGETAWFVEYDKAPSRILAHHWPDVPNHGDITTVDWSTVEPVDILTGGFPCQDVSLAGARRGLKDGTRSGLWSYFAEAIGALKPGLVVIENVRGLLSADASSGVESCPECVGDGPDAVSLRALGAVLGDLADLGYDAQWAGVRASDAGAPHGRFRVFIVAHPSSGRRIGGRKITGHKPSGDAPRSSNGNVANPAHLGHERGWRTRDGWTGSADSREPATDPASRGRDRGAQNAQRGQVERDAATGSCPDAWGNYGPAIRRWEHVLGRRAPTPTQPDGRDNGHRLSARFVEWMMGLDDGHVTDVGLTRNGQLKALGNGVVPQQAELALRILLRD